MKYLRSRLSRGLIACLPLLWSAACSGEERAQGLRSPSLAGGERPAAAGAAQTASDRQGEGEEADAQRHAQDRAELVAHLRAQGIQDEQVLAAIRAVDRHEMVPEPFRAHAYADRPLPIGHEQTISQPYVVALMTQLADIQPGEVVLEIGTGSGYQAAVLAELGAEVYSIEIVEPLARRTRELLDRMGYEEIHTRIGDGYRGWPDAAPFDAIVLTAAPPAIPEPLEAQLAQGGRLVAPVGEGYQELVVLTRTEGGLKRERSIPVRFVPMTGDAQDAD